MPSYAHPDIIDINVGPEEFKNNVNELWALTTFTTDYETASDNKFTGYIVESDDITITTIDADNRTVSVLGFHGAPTLTSTDGSQDIHHYYVDTVNQRILYISDETTDSDFEFGVQYDMSSILISWNTSTGISDSGVTWSDGFNTYSFEDQRRKVQDNIANFINYVTKNPTYIERSNYIKPDGEYETLYLSNIEPVSYDATNHGADEYGYNIRSKGYNVYATIRSYREVNSHPQSRQVALTSALEDPKAFSIICGDTVGVIQKGEPKDVSAPIDMETWEARSRTNLVFYTYMLFKESRYPGVIEKVETIPNVITP
jgi:hypothetical protein